MSSHATAQANTKRSRGRPSKKHLTPAASAAIKDIINKKGSKKGSKQGSKRSHQVLESSEDPEIEAPSESDPNTAATDLEESGSSPASSMASSHEGDGVTIDQLQLNTPKASPGKKFKTNHTSVEKKHPSSARQLFTSEPGNFHKQRARAAIRTTTSA